MAMTYPDYFGMDPAEPEEDEINIIGYKVEINGVERDLTLAQYERMLELKRKAKSPPSLTMDGTDQLYVMGGGGGPVFRTQDTNLHINNWHIKSDANTGNLKISDEHGNAVCEFMKGGGVHFYSDVWMPNFEQEVKSAIDRLRMKGEF